MLALIRRARAFFIGKEPLVFVAALMVVLGIWAFVFLLDEVREGGTKNFDNRVLRALRKPDDPSKLVGPRWVESVVRDVTALGGVVVLLMVVASVAGFLLLIRRYHMMWLVLIATIGATTINSTIKGMVDRPRPTSVPRLTDVSSESFPSGHSAMSAAVYLTLGGLLAQTVSRRRIKLYFLFIAMTLTFMVGFSRVCLGAHYPTDVLAGRAGGVVLGVPCRLGAPHLPRRRADGAAAEPTLPARKDA